MFVERRGLLSWKDREFPSEASLERRISLFYQKRLDEESESRTIGFSADFRFCRSFFCNFFFSPIQKLSILFSTPSGGSDFLASLPSWRKTNPHMKPQTISPVLESAAPHLYCRAP